jgi:rubredoxin
MTQQPVEKENGDGKMSAWRCTVCGYVYDPEEGDPDNGVEPGTPFEALPEDWVCPECGATKDLFEKLD